MKRQTGLMLAVGLFVGLGILVYELSWYASDVAVRVLLAMAIPACAVSLMASVFYAPRTTVEYYDPYPAQHKAEVEEQEDELPEPPPTSQDKLNFKSDSSRTITL
jgi:hypothetical protein